MFNLFALFADEPVYHYRVFLNTGSTIDVRNCKDLKLELDGGKISTYNFTFHGTTTSFRYIDPAAIVAITRL